MSLYRSDAPACPPLEAGDEEILSILERDARTPPAEIARMTGAVEAAVNTAIDRLERSGIIRSYKTVIDWERAGSDQVLAFVDVRVTPARTVGFDDIAERIFRFPEVRSVYLVSGDYDLRVVVEGRHIKEVAFFVSDRLASLERVLATTTHFLLKRYKEDGVTFVDVEEDDRLEVSP